MRYDTDNTIVLYSKNGDGSFNELIVDIYNREYAYAYNFDENKLLKSRETNSNAFLVEQNFLYAYYLIIEKQYSGHYNLNGNCSINRKEYESEEQKKPLIMRKVIRQAINWELDERELSRIISFDYNYEKDDYYDFDLIIEKIHALMNGERSISYFTSWCILLMRCFMNYMNCTSKKLSVEFYNLGDYLDGVAFMDSTLTDEEKLKECREIIAELKYYNHRICDLKSGTVTDFTTKSVITYVSFSFSLNDETELLYRVCIVDKKRRKINYLYIPEFDYSEGINYTFLSCAEFDDLPDKYYDGYSLDTSMTVEYALNKSIKEKVEI